MPCSSRIAGTCSSFSWTSFDPSVMAQRSHRGDEHRLVLAALKRPERHELDVRPDDQDFAEPCADRLGELVAPGHVPGELDVHGKRRILLDARALRADEDVAADLRRELVRD